MPSSVAGREADLAGLEVALERHEPEARRRALDDAHGPVPRAGHVHDVLVADAHLAVLAAHLLEARELGRRDAVGVAGDARDHLLGRHRGLADPRAVDAVEQRPVAVVGALDLVERDRGGSGGGASASASPRSSRRCSGTVRQR